MDASTLRWEARLPASVISVAATPALSLVVAGCVDRHGYALNHEGHIIWSCPTDHEVWAAACVLDGSVAAFGTAQKRPAGGKIYIVNRGGNPVASFPIGMPVWSLDFDPSGTRLAAGSWSGDLYILALVEREWRISRKVALGGSGVYGVRWRGPDEIVAASYGVGLCVVTSAGDLVGTRPLDTLGYNVSVDQAGGILVGARGGAVARFYGDKWELFKVPSAPRAAYGVASSADGSVVFAGGSDGYVTAMTGAGDFLWEADLVAEVWSVWSSPTGSMVVAGSGDGRVGVLNCTSTIEAMAEIRSHLLTLDSGSGIGDRLTAHKALLDLLCRLMLFGYAGRLLSSRKRAGAIHDSEYDELLEYLGQRCPVDSADFAELSFQRAGQRSLRGHHWDAALMYLRAALNPKLQLRAYSEAANQFYRANHQAAALACFRRARDAHLTVDDLKIIYTLARSFEDRGQQRAARDHLDMIMVQDPHYRDVDRRLVGAHGSVGFDREKIDYTGITVNLLGPEGPTSLIDPRLIHIVEARNRELRDDQNFRSLYDSVISELFKIGAVTARLGSSSVDYSAHSYVKYDSLLPEDDVKKRLELINAISLLKTVPDVSRSLDVGTATARYPIILTELGIEAYGIDIEPAAIDYAKSKLRPAAQRPVLSVGDARSIPFLSGYFDFVSCMMGTFFHIPLDDQPLALKEMCRVCRPDGMAIISCWDIDCPHLTFLSMYTVNEEEQILRNARRQEDMEQLFREAGFVGVGSLRLGLVPDTISYDLGIESLDQSGLSRLLEIDIAARASAPSKHGQMFITFGRAPGVQ